MSQLDQETSTEATLSGRLRPEEDPWSSLAVADDDVLGDHGIPSPVIGGRDSDAEGDVAPANAVGADAEPDRATADTADDSPDVRDDTFAPGHAILAREAESSDDTDTDEANEDETVLTMVDPAIEPTRGGAFTIPMLCAGIAIIACCLLIPQADANRRLAYERLKLQADLEAVQRQVAVNGEFLAKVSDDPNLAERLAQRQMKIIRAGTKVLALQGDDERGMSPFQLTNVAPPPALPAYRPRGGVLATLCYNSKSRLYLMGTGLLLTAAGLVLGFGARSPE